MEALSVEDMNRFLDFCLKDTNSLHCHDMLYVLFWTGLRASELCGLTLDNIDMKKRMIKVDKQLQCISHQHVVLPPKTLQYILGHGNISTTMNNYVDVRPNEEQLTQINAIANQLTSN